MSQNRNDAGLAQVALEPLSRQETSASLMWCLRESDGITGSGCSLLKSSAFCHLMSQQCGADCSCKGPIAHQPIYLCGLSHLCVLFHSQG